VAEGTLFTYFANKDELLNQLYLKLKTDLRDAMMTGYAAGKSLIDRNRHVWDRFIGWGSAHPLKRRAMRQLAVSDRITEESKKLVRDAYEEFDDMMRECAAGGAMRHQPPSFVSAIMSAIGDTTMDFIVREPAQAKRYTAAVLEELGFRVAQSNVPMKDRLFSSGSVYAECFHRGRRAPDGAIAPHALPRTYKILMRKGS
jgi:AcrR family transcriptional regulator